MTKNVCRRFNGRCLSGPLTEPLNFQRAETIIDPVTRKRVWRLRRRGRRRGKRRRVPPRPPLKGSMLLDVRNLSVQYGAIKALRDVSLHVDRGEIVTLIGSNGAGKTTLLRTISGLLKPSEGVIEFAAAMPAGKSRAVPASLAGLRSDQIVRLGISHSPEGRQIFANLSVRENLMLGAYQRTDAAEIARNLDRCYSFFPVLAERREQRSGTLSGGEQQMLAMGRALMQCPTLLLLDEPSLGLAPLVVRTIFQIVREINREGVTIFLVEQNARMALNVAHRAYVLQSGQVVMSDDAKALAEDPGVRKAYLGG
jgi:branched-chain amino acid transport system ATP-binding protein